MKDFNKILGNSLEVLFEENSKDDMGFMEGYTTNYIRVKAKGEDSIRGKILPVKIIDIEGGDILIGKIEEF